MREKKKGEIMQETLAELKVRYYEVEKVVKSNSVPSANDKEQLLFLKMKLARAERELFRNRVRRTIIMMLLGFSLFITGCESFAGLGRDIEWTADAGKHLLTHINDINNDK